MEFKKILKEPISFKINIKNIPTKGNLAWEYNPFHNYRLSYNKYFYKNSYWTLDELEDNFGLTIYPLSDNNKIKHNYPSNRIIKSNIISDTEKWYNCTTKTKANKVEVNIISEFINEENNYPKLFEKNLLVDLDTKELNFSLKHPVNILPQYSYDNSVNLILNDGYNQPRLINSRFSPLGKDTYEIVDRKGDNDTNIYDEGTQFDIDTSLYKRTIKIPKLTFDGVFSGGELEVGNYHFYFKYVDSDGNETDWIAESGLVSIFIGTEPSNINGGFGKQKSNKLVKFTLTRIDSAYNYVKVYYTKNSSGLNLQNENTVYEIDENFIIGENNICSIIISGINNVTNSSTDRINASYELVSQVDTQASCLNMLFIGNIHKPNIPYQELTDLSLRFLPYRNLKKYDLKINLKYEITSNSKGYYDSKYIYNFTGYWNDDIYRLGIVYIMPDNSLSPVFNIRGGYDLSDKDIYTKFDLYNNGLRNYINVSEEDYSIISTTKGNVKFENAKGVISLKSSSEEGLQIYGIKIKTDRDVILELKKYVKGFFFVRQKRMPTTLCQALTIGIDNHSHTPVIPIGNSTTLIGLKLYSSFTEEEFSLPKNVFFFSKKLINKLKSAWTHTKISTSDNIYISESFLSHERKLTSTFTDRLRPINKGYVSTNVAICPEYSSDLVFYSNLFTSDKFSIIKSDFLPLKDYFNWNNAQERNFYITQDEYTSNDKHIINSAEILAIPDSAKTMAIKDIDFNGMIGNAVDGWNFKYLGYDNKVTKAINLIRGIFSPYLGFVGTTEPLVLYDIKIPGYNENKISEYFKIRYNDNNPFYAISDRIDISNLDEDDHYETVLYRGDCYICQVSQRLNRNFQDPSAPNNDLIVDENCWKNEYEVKDKVIVKSKFSKINQGDLNAVPLGMWVTFTIRSTKNLCIRSVDESHSDEKSLVGHGRGFYPKFSMNVDGSYKIPEVEYFNKGFLTDVSDKLYFEVPNVPYIKNEFTNRIMYSNPAVIDSFTNNFRVFETSHYKDYSKEYGQIIKLIDRGNGLICVFEHGIGIINVNEKALLDNAQGDDVYIGTKNVLSDVMMISDKFGSLWADSIIQTPYYIYGVDTVAKKIWRVRDNIELISDLHILLFLNQNITLSEREKTPIIGIRNVKTHYNAFKSDVMFTFYDDLNGFNEKVWNICYNEQLGIWTTLYSWVPSYSANIYNLYFSFDRNTSKMIAKLGASKLNNDLSNKIVLELNVIKIPNNYPYKVSRICINDNSTYNQLDFKIEHDPWGNYKYFKIINNSEMLQLENGELLILNDDKSNIQLETLNNADDDYYLVLTKDKNDEIINFNQKTILLWITVTATITNKLRLLNSSTTNITKVFSNSIAITTENVLNNISNFDELSLTTDFWKHGQSGIIDIKEQITPTKWYGEQHPFEFEFTVSEYADYLKIFNNLQIISNSAEPESFHYWILGDSLSFADDKKNMYIRQEATKLLYQYNGCDIVYNEDYKDLTPKQNKISTILPLQYEQRNDTFNEVYDDYKKITAQDKNYDELSGSEITYDPVTGEFGVWVHSKAVDVSKQNDYKYNQNGRLRGNMQYLNDNWKVLISPINFALKNESEWNDKIPIVPANLPVPASVKYTNIEVPDDLKGHKIDLTSWGSLPILLQKTNNNYEYIYSNNCDENNRKQTKLRDKYIKIRIRYSGEKLAIIRSITTLYDLIHEYN